MDKMKFSYVIGEGKTVVSMPADAPWWEAVDRFVDFLQAAGYVVSKREVGAYLLEDDELSDYDDGLSDALRDWRDWLPKTLQSDGHGYDLREYFDYPEDSKFATKNW